MFEEKKPLEWIFQKKHSTHFGRYKNHNKYGPATNTAANAEREEELKASVEKNDALLPKLHEVTNTGLRAHVPAEHITKENQ